MRNAHKILAVKSERKRPVGIDSRIINWTLNGVGLWKLD
jgi:hypothetical protein